MIESIKKVVKKENLIENEDFEIFMKPSKTNAPYVTFCGT